MRSLLRHSRLLLALVGLCVPAGFGVAAPAPSPADSPSAQGSALSANEMMLPVPTVTIYPGDTIKESMLRLQAYPTTYRARAAVIDAPLAVVGRTARRMLLPGEPVPVNAVDDPRLVSRGAPTQMIFEENGLVITAVGSPLQNGGLGETIRVRNTDTNRIVLGTVTADGRIKIGGF
ncbi:flagellar basal body P-ring formation chaperone FlgA [Methylobacterium sp. EM32]|uniref:flagellar basal body P-ring formation chaperone FlgA n=2 Tax=Methylobacterium TaxID=407 RepID=UPI0038B29EEC